MGGGGDGGRLIEISSCSNFHADVTDASRELGRHQVAAWLAAAIEHDILNSGGG